MTNRAFDAVGGSVARQPGNSQMINFRQSMQLKKSAREILAGAFQFSASKATLPLRPRGSGGSRFLVSDYSRGLRLGQHDFAYDDPITHCRIVNGSRHIRSDRR